MTTVNWNDHRPERHLTEEGAVRILVWRWGPHCAYQIRASQVVGELRLEDSEARVF